MKALITGVGIVGKSSFRRMLKSLISGAVDIDGDYEEMPSIFNNDLFYIIEDVHALTSKPCLPIENYDLIFYLLPSPFSHLTFWFKRMIRWFENGKGGWDKETQDWVGNKKPYSLSNIPAFFNLLIHDFKNRKKWIKEDMEALSLFLEKTTFVYPQWTKGQIKFDLS